ncbi:MAG TPA: chemotaxis protein CheW [Pirellulales bacterium]|nr:chemotaxis protein CheW [Pirellulales bacterium]
MNVTLEEINAERKPEGPLCRDESSAPATENAAAAVAKEFRRRAKMLAQRSSRRESSGETCAVLAFKLSAERYGIKLSRIVQVYPCVNCSPLPGAPPELLGVVNIRGRIYSVLDLAQMMGLSKSDDLQRGAIVLARHAGIEVGLRVDEVEQIELFSLDQLIATSDDLAALSTAYVQRRTANGLAVLNLAAVFSHPVFFAGGRTGMRTTSNVNVKSDAAHSPPPPEQFLHHSFPGDVSV